MNFFVTLFHQIIFIKQICSQIGRSSESPIDFVVMDTYAGGADGGPANEGRVAQSTISRFACRILADRSDPRIARIYAAGFDSSSNIFLGVRFKIYDRSYDLILCKHYLFLLLTYHLISLCISKFIIKLYFLVNLFIKQKMIFFKIFCKLIFCRKRQPNGKKITRSTDLQQMGF